MTEQSGLWAIQWQGSPKPDAEFCFDTKEEAENTLRGSASWGTVVPLYRASDEERAALDWAIDQCNEYDRVGLPEAEKALRHLRTLQEKLK
jgi:hypothetical protein